MARLVIDLKQGIPALHTIANLPSNALPILLRKPNGDLQRPFGDLPAHQKEANDRLATGIPVTAADLWCDTIFFLAFEVHE